MRISRSQQKIIDLMAGDWELAANMTMNGKFWIQKGGAGHGGEARSVHGNTAFSLLQKGLIQTKTRNFPKATYELTEEGLACVSASKPTSAPGAGPGGTSS